MRVCNWKLFSYFSTRTYAVGTQENRLNETVLLSTQNTCLNRWIRKKSHFINIHLKGKLIWTLKRSSKAKARATDKDLGQLVFTKKICSQSFFKISNSFNQFFLTVHYLIFQTYWTLQSPLQDLICHSYDNFSAFQLCFCLSFLIHLWL